MEEGDSPPPGGAEGSQNPDENPRAFHQDGENPPTPQIQNPSNPPQTTFTYLDPQEGWDTVDNRDTSETTSLPPPPPLQTGIPHHNTQAINTDSPVVYTREADVAMTLRPQTPPPI